MAVKAEDLLSKTRDECRELTREHDVIYVYQNRIDAHCFKLLDDPAQHRSQLIFITTGCFSRRVNDTWIKLAMIRLARQKLSSES